MTLNYPISHIIILFPFIMTAGSACDRSAPAGAAPPPAASSAEPGIEVPKSQEGHGHGPEKSDLDRPVEELVGLTCEHQVKTYLCDECRYEVGFVKVVPSLVDEGLIRTSTALRKNVSVPLALTGEVRFDERRVGHVSSQVEGIIKKVFVTLGDPVKAGQPLAELESVTVGEGQTALYETQGILALARKNYQWAEQLRQKNISSEKEFLEAKQELEAARIRSNGAWGRLRSLGSTGASGGRVKLIAPVDGTVLMMHSVMGEVARTDEKLFTIVDNAIVWVWADVYERDLEAVKTGQAAGKLSAKITVKAYPGTEFTGTVDLVSPAMDEATRTIKVRIEVNNADGRLLAGMFTRVQLFLPAQESALTVPETAVLEDDGRSFVFVHFQGEYHVRRPVRTGRAWPGWVEIVSGLQENAVVVSDGAFLLKSDVLRSKMGAGCAD